MVVTGGLGDGTEGLAVFGGSVVTGVTIGVEESSKTTSKLIGARSQTYKRFSLGLYEIDDVRLSRPGKRMLICVCGFVKI